MNANRLAFGLQTSGAILGMALLLGSSVLAVKEYDSSEGAGALDATLPPMGLGDGSRSGFTPAAAEEIAAIYSGVFHATVYYTPLEEAFLEEAGFDMTPTTRQGLRGKQFPRDFLKAVELEGFGRMRTPVEGKKYVSCCRGRWDYAEAPLDSCGQPLRAFESTAVAAEYELVRSQANFRVQAMGLPPAFRDARWKVCDTGGGLKPGQIDFYWGEDAPMGPGVKLSCPRGLTDPIVNPTVAVLR
jgi:hypothetical protein